MSRKKCGQLGQIERRVRTSQMLCHKKAKKVVIYVCGDDKHCTDKSCEFSPAYVKPAEVKS
jgi:hypothetical protein